MKAQSFRRALRPTKRFVAPTEAKIRLGHLYLRQYLAALKPPDDWLHRAHNNHAGETCFILGNGPSLKAVDVRRLADRVTFGVNAAYLLEELSPTYYVTISTTFWRHHVDEIKSVVCTRRFLATDMRELESDVPTSWMRFQRPVYMSRLGYELPVPLCFSRRPDRWVQGGGTVLFVCLQLAYHLGFRRAVLLGVDHDYGPIKRGRKEKWGRGEVFEGTGATHFTDRYHSAGELFHVDLEAMERAYGLARDAFLADGRTVVNASPGTKLEIIPRMSFEQTLEMS